MFTVLCEYEGMYDSQCSVQGSVFFKLNMLDTSLIPYGKMSRYSSNIHSYKETKADQCHDRLSAGFTPTRAGSSHSGPLGEIMAPAMFKKYKTVQ